MNLFQIILIKHLMQFYDKNNKKNMRIISKEFCKHSLRHLGSSIEYF